MASSPSEDLTKEVYRWLVDEKHAEEKEAALKSLWKETDGNVDMSTLISLDKVYNKIGKSKRGGILFLSSVWKYSVAALVILAVSISATFFFISHHASSEVAMVQHFTSAGDMAVIKLPDGSEVQTNSETLLFYPEVFNGATRTVYLVGEANFKVKKNPDQPFIVKSDHMSITALGTEFNVDAYPGNGEMTTTLIHGKVKVDFGGGSKNFILNPGQQVVYQRNTSAVQLLKADIEDVTAWQRGLFVFKGVTIKDVLATLEHRYAVTFQYNANLFNDDKYNFRFHEKSSINDIMTIMQEVVGTFSYRLDGDICYIKGLQKQRK